MTNWNAFSLGSQLPTKTVAPVIPPSPTPAPQPAPQSQVNLHNLAMPFGLLANLGKPNAGADLFSSLSGGSGGILGGLLSGLFGHSQPAQAEEPKTVIDKRPDAVQALVSMFSNGGTT